MSPWSKDEVSSQETSERNVPQTLSLCQLRASAEARMLDKVKLYDRRAQAAEKFRHSSCRCDEAAVKSVIRQHGMTSQGTECQSTFTSTDNDPYVYVFVEVLQLIDEWISEHRHFTNLLQLALWEKREKVVDLLRSLGVETSQDETSAVRTEILYDVLRHHRPCRHAACLLNNMLHSDIETLVIHIVERGFELIADRFDDHVLEARTPAGRDVLKCLFHILSRVITDLAYVVDFWSAAIDIVRGDVIRNTLSSRRRRGRWEAGDVCQKLFKAAVKNGNSELARILLHLPQLRRYINVNSTIDRSTADTALHLACRMGSTLVNPTFDNQPRGSELTHPVKTVDNQSVLLLQCPHNYYRFVAAAADGCQGLDTVRMLTMTSEMRKQQLNVHLDNYVELIHQLIRHGVDINATNRRGETALHVAASI